MVVVRIFNTNIVETFALLRERFLSFYYLSLALADRSVLHRVECLGKHVYLAQVTGNQSDHIVGSSLGSSLFRTLFKAYSEYRERDAWDRTSASSQIRSIGYASSPVRRLAESRAYAELIERDALVTFWDKNLYLSDISDQRILPHIRRMTSSLAERTLVLEIPSADLHVSLCLLLRGARIISVGCAAKSSLKEAAKSALSEAVMLSLNETSTEPRDFDVRKLIQLDSNSNKTKTPPKTVSGGEWKHGFYHAWVSSDQVSGISHGRAFLHTSRDQQSDSDIQCFEIPYFTDYATHYK